MKNSKTYFQEYISESLLILSIIFMFSSCDIYKSQVPISNDKVGVEMKALGKWVACEKNREGLLVPICELEVLNWGDEEDLLIFSTFGKIGIKSNDRMLFKIWISSVKDEDYVNAKLINNLNEDYYFYRYKLDENGTLKIKYLKDSLTQTFESSIELNNYIRKNNAHFNSYFSDKWVELVKWDSLKWSVVNENILDEISRLLVLDRTIQYEAFKTKSIESLLPYATSFVKPENGYLTFLDQYHLVAENSPSEKVKPMFLLLELKNGEYRRILKGYNWILDLENDLLFRK